MTAAAAPAPSMFAVFRRRDFSLLWLAQFVSTAGSSLTDLAAGIYVWRETESALAVGLTLIYGVLHIINFAHGESRQRRTLGYPLSFTRNGGS